MPFDGAYDEVREVLAIETWHDTRVFWWKRFFYRNRPPIEILSGFDQAIALRA
jgi:hypothetical protein